MSKKEEKRRKIYNPAGVIGKTIYESVVNERGEPEFIWWENGKLHHQPQIVTDTEMIMPPTRTMIPYRPYKLLRNVTKNLDRQKLYEAVLKQFNDFLDIELKFNVLNAVQILETYQQHKLSSTSYLFAYGEISSGKTRCLELHNHLDYRPLFSCSLPSADIYTFLGQADGSHGTILEDEAEDLSKKRYADKMKIYRAGYRKGSMVPRIELTRDKKRIQNFYRAFSCKIFAGRWIPNNPAFEQRCIPIPMVEGYPEKDEIKEKDLQRFDNIKSHLLVWRLQNYHDNLPEIKVNLHGRIKELWKPKLQVAYGLDAYEAIKKLSVERKKMRDEEIRNSLEARLTKVVIESYVKMEGMEIPFSEIWNGLMKNIGEFTAPNMDFQNAPSVETKNFGKISRNIIGLKLKSIFSGKRHLRGNLGRTYSFDIQRLLKLARKYRLDKTLADELRKVVGNQPDK